MPRASALSNDDVVTAAMRHFWQRGYHATSVDELVAATGASRHAIYGGIGNKHALYRAGFAAYQRQVVTPAFAAVEQPGADLAAIERFFETQIALAEVLGFPGPGCLVANAATETAPHDTQIASEVTAHHLRLKTGFANVLSLEGVMLSVEERDALADFLVIITQGLWSMSRTVTSAAPLRRHVSTLFSLLQARLTP
jgi:TetR/AcrR family transcriptional regulator, transcriptional repressor for nem operon